MFISTFLVAILSATTVSAAINESLACVGENSVHIYTARGTAELWEGLLGLVTESIVDKLPGSNVENVIYPAGFSEPLSDNEGTVNMTGQVRAYNARCPDSKMVFLGYSQGAEVVGDVIAGGGSSVHKEKTADSPPLESYIMDQVVAIIQFGDPNRVYNPAWDMSTCTVDSDNPRTGAEEAKFLSYESRIQEWCHSDDFICCSTGVDPIEHVTYFLNGTKTVVVDFIAERVDLANNVPIDRNSTAGFRSKLTKGR